MLLQMSITLLYGEMCDGAQTKCYGQVIPVGSDTLCQCSVFRQINISIHTPVKEICEPRWSLLRKRYFSILAPIRERFSIKSRYRNKAFTFLYSLSNESVSFT